MDRLTRRTEEEFANNNGIYYLANATSKKVLNKLGEYEDAEEQGLLLRLPCKIGDTLYTFYYPRGDIVIVVEEEVIEITVPEDGILIETYGGFYRFGDFGKTVFLTKEEAEQALAKMKEV